VSKSVALVTGASSGIGKATALRLAALGFTVYAAARRVERMSGRHGIHVESLDVTDDGSMVWWSTRRRSTVALTSENNATAPMGQSSVPIAEARNNSTSTCSGWPGDPTCLTSYARPA
jgi:NAD(P)-dependent dehydrogenase (short-subunit alcohol dehydrogenase family)